MFAGLMEKVRRSAADFIGAWPALRERPGPGKKLLRAGISGSQLESSLASIDRAGLVACVKQDRSKIAPSISRAWIK